MIDNAKPPAPIIDWGDYGGIIDRLLDGRYLRGIRNVCLERKFDKEGKNGGVLD